MFFLLKKFDLKIQQYNTTILKNECFFHWKNFILKYNSIEYQFPERKKIVSYFFSSFN